MIQKNYVLLILIIILFSSFIFTNMLFTENNNTEKVPADKIYMSEGRSFIEIDANNFSINRTIDLRGTSVEINYDNETNNLFAAVGATNKMYEINRSNFSIIREYNEHTFNVQDTIPDIKNGYIYTTSSDNTVHKIEYNNLTKTSAYDKHNGSVMVGEKVNDFIYTATLDFTISKINSKNMSEKNRITKFPETLGSLSYDKEDNNMYYGGGLGTIYRINLNNYDKYNTYYDIPESSYNNIEFNKPPHLINTSEIDRENYGIIKIRVDNKNDIVFAGGGHGLLYKIDMETLEVIDTYNVSQNRQKSYDFSKYSAPSIKNDNHIYNYDIRGIELGPKSEYVYITTAPGSLIEISVDDMQENRRLETKVEARTVSLAVK